MTGPALRGREAPMRVLHDALASAHAGRGQLVLIAGDAGIGKSALAEALAAQAAAGHTAVTWGRAWEFAQAPPYFPLRPCMRSLGIELAGAELDDGRAFELWERVLSALAHETSDATVLWCVEDVHAADLGTLDLLTYLARPVRAMRALVVATLRPHDPRLDERKLQRIARMTRDGLELRLEPLGETDVAAVAADTLGRALPGAALRRFVELTGGNPLFVVECARAVRSGDLDRVLAHLPPSVRHVVTERVALLPTATRALLDAGAVLGRELAAATVARMVDSEPARVIDELLPALRAGVLRETRPGCFTFSHVVVRDAIEDAIPADARADLHARADAALAELGDRAEILVERARHAIAAGRACDPAATLALSGRAIELLEREGAFDRAFELYTKLEAARAAGSLPAASAPDKLHLARIARDAGRIDVMQRACDEVIALARGANDHVLFTRAVLLHATIVRPGVIDTRQVALMEDARAALPPDSPEKCRVLARLATALQPADDPRTANEHARAARRAAHAIGDDALVRDVLAMGALGLWGAPRAERIEWCEELRVRALDAGDVPRSLKATSLLGLWFMEGGDVEGFADACTKGLALADVAHPRDRWEPLLFASGHACALGNFAESERHVTEVQQIAALIDDPALEVALVLHAIGRAKLRRRRDELTRALEGLDHGVRELKRAPLIAALTRASCYAHLGDVDATRAQLGVIGNQARVVGHDYEPISMLAQAYALAGTDDQRRWARDLLEAADVKDMFGMGGSYVYEGSSDWLLGLLDAALGDLASAEERLRRCLALAVERRMRPWIAQLAHQLAEVVTRRSGDARDLVAQAAALGGELGMNGIGALEVAPEAPLATRISRTADVWTIERGAAVARVKDSRGMQLLARLLERPGEDIHVLALASDEGASAPDGNAGEMLDERARRTYRRRLTELDAALELAEQRGDSKASVRLEAEKSALVRELARATGLGGRTRVAGSGTERARVNVQRRLKEALARIAEAEPALGAYLVGAVRTGTYCCFTP